METTSFNVVGVAGDDTADRLRNSVLALSGVSNASLNLTTSKLTVTFDPETANIDTIKGTIAGNGFSVS